MTTDLNTPRLRFAGFHGEWERRKLGDCLEICDEINTDDRYGKNEVLSVSEEQGVMNQIELLGRSYAGKSVSNYKILRPNQIVYTKSPLRAKPFGIIKVNHGETGIVSVLYAVYNCKGNISPDYIHYYFDPCFRINNYMRPLVNKGAKNTMNITDEAALEGFVSLPPTLPEQQKIGAFFSSLDAEISREQERVEKLRQLKAACLQDMFPREGENVPRVRFAGCSGGWERRKFSDLYEVNKERNEELIGYDKTLSVASMTFRNEGNGAAESSLPTYKVLRLGDIAFEGHRSREFKYGRFVVNDVGDGIMSPRFRSMRPLQQMPVLFWKYYIHCERVMRSVLLNCTKAGTMMNELVEEDFLKQSILAPTLPEQQKIGAFFSSLDAEISREQERVEKLRQLKAACLGQMFVGG